MRPSPRPTTSPPSARPQNPKPYVTIDTEFLRERTYWSKLCLIQMALPGKDGDAVLVDPIEGEDMSMEPLYDLFRHEATVKVFHAARQDLEIFFVEGQVFPKPLFDTQVAAMVCGFGEQVGYETLVKKIANGRSTRPRASPTGRAAP
jgi:ribonuclease D